MGGAVASGTNAGMSRFALGRAGYVTGLFFFSSRRRHTRYWRDWSSDVCSSDLPHVPQRQVAGRIPERKARHPLPALFPVGQRMDQAVQVVGVARAVTARRAVRQLDRKSVAQGKSVDLGGRRILKKKIRLVPLTQ